jgi:hypothetical protein
VSSFLFGVARTVSLQDYRPALLCSKIRTQYDCPDVTVFALLARLWRLFADLKACCMQNVTSDENGIQANQLPTAHGTKGISCHSDSDKGVLYFVFVLNLRNVFPRYSCVDNIEMDVK